MGWKRTREQKEGKEKMRGWEREREQEQERERELLRAGLRERLLQQPGRQGREGGSR